MRRLIPFWLLIISAYLINSTQAFAFDDAEPASPAVTARRELLAARYQNAADLYSKLTGQQPEDPDAWYGLVRAELGLHHSKEAYAAADQAIAKDPQSAGAQTAEGLAMYRRGDLVKAEQQFRSALKIDPDYPGALKGLASVCTIISMSKTARELLLRAYARSPDDPELMVFHASLLKGGEHIAVLQEALAHLDPASEEANNLRVHIANDQTLGGHPAPKLVSPYQSSQVKLFRILDGPNRQRGWGIGLMLNAKTTVHLLLDTGSTGISVSPGVAEKAGLQLLGGVASEARGFGDGKPGTALGYLASEVKIGDIVFADYPISVFRAAQTQNFDGRIGTDVFRRFLVRLDLVHHVLSLTARPDGDPTDAEEPADWNMKPETGAHRFFRFGNRLAVATFINGRKDPEFFLVNSGATVSLIDTEMAKTLTTIDKDPTRTLRGIQGRVDQVSRAYYVSLLFCGLRQENPALMSISMDKVSDTTGVAFGGVLGMPALANLAVFIDYRKGTIRFEYTKP